MKELQHSSDRNFGLVAKGIDIQWVHIWPYVHASTGCHTSVITSVDGNVSMLAPHVNHPKKLKQQPEEQVIMNVVCCQE